MLAAGDALPGRPRRVVVAGTSGSGKTTLARVIAGRLGVPHVEIDGLFHGPGWTPRESFLADVEEFTGWPGWCTEWQYSSARELLAARADLMVWLELPVRTVMRQVVARTVRRRLRRQELWNGNVEPPFRAIFTDPEYIVRWAWDTRHKAATLIGALPARHPDLPVVRLRSHRDARRWLDGPLAATVG
jgi:adenylate kinase family enzyme